MAKKTDSFFDDEDLDEDLDEEEGKKAPEKKKPENEDPKHKDDDKDKIDWKAKYEAAEAEKLDRSYYDELVVNKNFKGDIYSKIKMFNFPGKMIVSQLSLVHKTAIKSLKKIALMLLCI